MMVSLPGHAWAVIINSGQGNLTPPSDDPGFFNVSDSGSSMVYLGDSWVLTAAHTGIPDAASFAGKSYALIPNTTVQLHNPAGLGLTDLTDLRMFRINGNPELPSLTISAAPPGIGTQVTLIGRGRRREDLSTQWNVQMNGDNWIWSETFGAGQFRGYKVPGDGVRETRWGTNRIANEDPIVGESDANHTTVIEVSQKEVVALLTLWEESGGTFHEAQAVAGDSGGAVYYKRGVNWELAGIMNAVLTFPNQSIGWAIYGQATAFADLSLYRSEILSLMNNPAYSIPGDVNLDGVVRGDGTGPASSDDLTAFRAGWLTRHPVANIDSWKLGDLNQDAVTNLHDFRLLRKAHPSAALLTPALGLANTAGIPEPATCTLLLLVSGCLAVWGLRRRKRCSLSLS